MGILRQSGTLAHRAALVVFALAAMAGCRPMQLASPATACQTGVVEIAIWDGYLQTVCNCGTNGEFIVPGTALACSFPVGSKVFVYYNGPKLIHQFVSVGTPSLPEGPIFDPSASAPLRVHAFEVDVAGTYSFRDAYYGELNGTFTVTP